MRRKFLSVVLCVCMMFTMVPFAFAANTTVDSYQALQTALESASNGDTITLSNDIIFTPTQGQSGHLNPQICIGESVTLNLNNHKIAYDSNCMSTSYTGTPTLLSIKNGATVTIIGNGTIDAELGNNGSYAINVTDDSQLIIENGNFYGAPTAVQIQKGSFIAYNGNFNLASTISNIQNSATAYAKYIVNCIDAAFKDGTAKVQLIGGTYGYDFSNRPEGEGTTYIPSGYNVTESNGSYFISEKSDNVAQINGVQYATLPDAVEAAVSGDTITMLKDATVTTEIDFADKAITLDLNSKTVTGTLSAVTSVIEAQGENGSLTLEDTSAEKAGKLLSNKYGISAAYGGKLTINSGTIESEYAALAGNNTAGDMNFEVNGGTLTSKQSEAIYMPGQVSLVVNDGTLNGGISTRMGQITINGGTINGMTGATDSIANYYHYSGSAWIGDAIYVLAGTYDSSNAEYTNSCNIKITGGTINGNNQYGVAVYKIGTGKEQTVNVNIEGGKFSGSKGAISTISDGFTHSQNSNGKCPSGETTHIEANPSKVTTNISVSGGYFTSDPTPYCGTKDGKQLTGVASKDSSYPYTVGEKNAESKPATVDSATVPAKTTSTDATVIAAANSISGASVTNNNATEAATRDIANENQTTGETEITVDGQKKTVEQALTAISTEANKPSDSNPVTIVYQTYVDVTVTGAKKDNNNSLTELTVSLTPMYRVVATTKSVAESTSTEIKLDGEDTNAILIENAKKLNVPAHAYEVTLALPSNFDTAGDKLSIKHTKENGSIEYYTGTVTTDKNNNKFVTFTTNGFSPFVIYAASANVASIGNGENEQVFTSFQAAVDAVENGGTIKALKNIDSTVSGNKSFKVNANDKTVKLTAASGYTLTKDAAGKYTVSHQSSGGPGSSGGSISAPTTYAVNVNAATNGAVAADKKTASKGTTVTVTASPSKGYVVDAVKVVDKDGKDVAVTGKDGKYVFTMPGSAVTVTGTFKAETPAPVALPFTDVKSGNWFYDAVKYAYEQGLMTGTSATTFAPNGTMNRAMIVTVLYRLEKSPAVTGASKFTDVPAGQWYSDAVAWAAANKIVNGYDETTFGPMNAVTREQMAAILFRYEQYKGLENVTLEENLNRFPDQNKISAYAIPALQWAVGQKIINGNADGTLDPTGNATRAQVAQIFTNLLNQ